MDGALKLEAMYSSTRPVENELKRFQRFEGTWGKAEP